VISPEFGSEEPAPRTEPLVYEAPDEAALSDNVVYSASYGSWSVICIGGEFNSRECHTETSVFRRDYAREPVVILRITPTSASPTGLAMALSTPNNVLLQLNANLSIAGSTFVAPYTICDDSFCTARVDISQELLARLLQNRAGFVAFTNPPSSEVYIPLEFGGLLEAISDLNQQLQVSQG
jgi:invasion protein IalB